MQHIYALNTSDDLLLGLIPLAVYCKINLKCLKYLTFHILNTTCDPESNCVWYVEIESTEVINIS